MGSKVKKTVRNIIPNEISKIAVKAAPIVAMIPGQQGTAALMAGIGSFDQTGSLSQGLRSGATTFAVGQLGQSLPKTQSSGFQGFLEGATRRAITTAASQGLRGQDINVRDALLTGAIGEGVGSLGTTNFLPEPVQNFAQRTGLDIGRGITTAAGSALTDVALGRDVNVEQALLSGGLETALTPERLKAIGEKFPKPFGDERPGVVPGQEGFDTTDLLDDGQIDLREPMPKEDFSDFLETGIEPLQFDEEGDFIANPTLGSRIKTALDERYNFSKIKEALTGPNKDIFEAVKLSAKAITKPEIFVGVPTIVAGLMAPTPEEEEEGTYDFAQRKLDVTNYLRQYGSKFYSGQELDDFIERSFAASGTAFSETLASGGRVGYANGSKDKEGIMMASAPSIEDDLDQIALQLFKKPYKDLTDDEIEILNDYKFGLMAKGGMPTGIMRTNAAGIKERDYRETGGFVPVGIKEKADDVPAMLSKNEFVMTADAVRGAGNGSIEKGAQKMYDTMKELENRVA